MLFETKILEQRYYKTKKKKKCKHNELGFFGSQKKMLIILI